MEHFLIQYTTYHTGYYGDTPGNRANTIFAILEITFKRKGEEISIYII